MAIKPNKAKIIDLDAVVESVPVDTPEGPVVWAAIAIQYTLSGLSPGVTIRVPLSWKAGESDAAQRARALQSARLLIEHACRAAGVGPSTEDDGPADVLEALVPPALEGLTQELGLAPPATRPRRAHEKG
jgi:hypothetical protein